MPLPDEDEWLAEFEGWITGSGARSEKDVAHVPVEESDKERVYLVGVQVKERPKKGEDGGRAAEALLQGRDESSGVGKYTIHESLEELERLAEAAGLEVAGSTYQMLQTVDPRTYIGSGKVDEIAAFVRAYEVDTVIFDDELSPGQLRSLERILSKSRGEEEDSVRVCDRTALILDIFSQRAATKEGMLQVELAQHEYQLPRLTKMWSHLERQAGRGGSGGAVKGMGESQKAVDRYLLKKRMASLRGQLEEVRKHRGLHRRRREENGMPVVALVGYTNAGKSTLLNRLAGAEHVTAQDRLFETLDPTTRRVRLPSGREALATDTVGFIQRLPTQLVAAFRATLEEIEEADIIMHVVDISSPLAAAQVEAVQSVLGELDTVGIPQLIVWNKVDACDDPRAVAGVARRATDTVWCSARTGDNAGEVLAAIERKLAEACCRVKMLVPFAAGDLLSEMYEHGMVEEEEHGPEGTTVTALVPTAMLGRVEARVGEVEILRPARRAAGREGGKKRKGKSGRAGRRAGRGRADDDEEDGFDIAEEGDGVYVIS
ncbi:unnamed protein product [Pedinophyceae sp. YPF-701]|nr:unnamed protein product [Pedinophyceae sp. YPF-701]